MDRLWAPWRAVFVEAGGSPKQGCIFCAFLAADESRDKENLLVLRAGEAFVMLNKYPYNNGHAMVVPRAHVDSLDALSPESFAALHELLGRTVVAVRKAYQPEGLNLGMNLGAAAGAGIADHLHWHVVPRWKGDTNFMPVVGETKVMIESLESSWERLRAAFLA